jgi:hypothetical protein
MIVTPADSSTPSPAFPRATRRFWWARHVAQTSLVGLAVSMMLAVLPTRAAEPAAAQPSPAAERFSIADCMDCHSDATLTRKVQGKDVPLSVVDTNVLAKSIHGKLLCVDCHAGMTDLVHESDLPPAQCTSCHEPQTSHDTAAKEYAVSIHGVSRAMGGTAAATCADCHGAHNILPANNSESSVFKLNLPQTCARCHSNPGLTKEYEMKYPQVASQYQDSIHGRALLKMGLIVAPSCNDCHGVHDIKRRVDKMSPINRASVAKTCGKCHLKIEEVYNKSIHGQLLAKGDLRAPVCTDCHTAHQIESPSANSHFKAVSDRRCGECHEDRLLHYRDTYHGKAMALGKPNVAPDVAACYDCHGHHDVLPASDPASHLSPANITQTCKRCHSGATPSFAQYKPHANPMDRQNYPVLHAVFVVYDRAVDWRVHVFWRAHAALAVPINLSVCARLQEVSRSQGARAGR